MSKPNLRFAALAGGLLTLGTGAAVRADSPPPPAVPTYADLADLADSAPLVIRVQPRKATALEPERARGVRPGWARLYVEAKVESLIAGKGLAGDGLRYLVDIKRDAKGKAQLPKKKSMVIFARPVAGRPGEVQLVAPDAQILWDQATGERLRAILNELYAPGAPQRITAIREAIHVPGSLAGEGESQIFLTSANGEPAAISVARAPGRAPVVSVSFSELVGASNQVPARDTLAWYRLACFLPSSLPAGANSGSATGDRAAAAEDYAYVLAQLGQCPRLRG